MLRWAITKWRVLSGLYPWMDVPKVNPWGNGGHDQHKFEAVSRHSIAETGLICPRCETEVCQRGDYYMVHRFWGGEVVRCNGTRHTKDADVPCLAYLAASPDTEHGDDKLIDKVPKGHQTLFYQFRKKSRVDVVRELYGDDIKEDKYMGLAASEIKIGPKEKKKAKFLYSVGDIFQVSDGQAALVLYVEKTDVAFNGWCKVELSQSTGAEWWVDTQGKIRVDMTDPTKQNNLFLVEQRRLV